MWKNYLLPKGNRFALLIGQLMILLISAAYIGHVYESNIYPDQKAKAYFQQTDCFLVSKRLTTAGRLIHRYRADFLISYSVGSVQYNRWVSGNGMDLAFSQHKNEQETILSQYNVGRTYSCRYNPDDPQVSVLVMRHNWVNLFPLILPALVNVIALYFFLNSLFQLMGSFKNKRNEEATADSSSLS